MEDERADDFCVALEGNLLFQKYVAQRAVRGKELQVSSLDEVHRGFVTGLDREWMTMTTTEGLQAVLIHLETVTNVKETGVSLDQLAPDKQDRIREFGAVFLRIAQREIARSK